MNSGDDRYVIRAGRISDASDFARLQASVQMQAATGGQPHSGVAAWVEDLLDGHPSVRPDDFLVAEDAATGRVAASLVGLRQDWTLAGLRLPVVQIELVGVAPEHRGNRLTDRLIAALHQRHATDGVSLQMIEGIPYFYRRFGYDYAMANDGASTVPAAVVPASEPGPSNDGYDGLTVRPATDADADALAGIDRRRADDHAWACPRDAAVWRHEIAGHHATSLIRREVAVLLRGTGIVGYLVHGARLSSGGHLIVVAAACGDPADWSRAAPAMHGYLGHIGRHYEVTADRPFTAVRHLLDPRHPLPRLGPSGVPQRPREWFVRTGDPADLLARLQPLLRARWREADLRWPEPTLIIDTYGPACRLEFIDGELAAVSAVRGAPDPSTDPGTHATVPPGALLQLALGHRTLPRVLDTWPDCLIRDRATEHFLATAFPRVPVHIWPRN
jgi:predicted N-acetyltransferase YhbS